MQWRSRTEFYNECRPVVPEGGGAPWHPQILADQLTLSQPGGTDYAYLITTDTSGFSDIPTTLDSNDDNPNDTSHEMMSDDTLMPRDCLEVAQSNKLFLI